MSVESVPRQAKTLRLVLGDQLNLGHSWFETRDHDVLYLIAELPQEAVYVRHHVQKLCAFFAAMAEFARTLEKRGHHVLYLTLDTNKYNDLGELIKAVCVDCAAQYFEYQHPDEHRLQQQLGALGLPQSITVKACDSEHFLLGRDELGDHVKASRHNRMETFYRRMRQRCDLLMDGDEPAGGQWNYDSENRNKLKQQDLEQIPEPLLFDNDVGDILQRLDRNGVETFGKRVESLPWPVSRAQGLELLGYFCEHGLPRFGRFQDAMTCRHPHRWSLYHSRLSFALNSKMLSPLEVMQAAIEKYETSSDAVSLAQIEGFVRQILGWREYVRAVYWVNMPAYAELNALQAGRNLPGFFWDGRTGMNCMRHAIGQSLEHAYAHHIQRLMITGNFCLLAGIDPDQVDAWYLGVYVDAIEWVEMPNTRGMSQFADGGLVATKPYSAGANYINRMSDYCRHCAYDYRDKTSQKGCPFNSLYWDFMVRHRDRFGANPRIGMIYRNWDRQSAAQRDATLQRAEWCLQHLPEL
ncbi:MAG: cryptochrome/photolyase family protein [Gammaproteobacteria bacterium]|nr:cryptochrome/photolyase family protein [Gammaproteobacteria bacterium]